MDFIKDKGKNFSEGSKGGYHMHSFKYKHTPCMHHTCLILYPISAIKMPLDNT